MRELIDQALLNHNTGKLDLAEKLYLEILNKEKNNPSILQLLGTLYLQSKKFSLSEEFFLKSLSIDPNNPNTLNNLGILKKKTKDINQSLEYFDTNIIKNNFLKSWINKSNIFLETSRYKDGLELSNQALKNYPEDIKLRNNYAIFLFESGFKAEALNIYNKFDLEGSHIIESYLSYSSLLIQINNFPKALQNLNKLLKIDSKNLEGLRKRHFVYKSLMNFEKAEEDLNLAISINKFSFLNNKMIVEFYIDINKYDQSIKYCDLMIEKDIEKDFFISKKIISKIHIGDWEKLKEMISDFNESKKFNTGMSPLSLKYINDDALTQKLFTEKYWKSITAKGYKKNFINDSGIKKKSKLKIGYFSGDFRNHAVFHLIQDLFVNHDKSQFEIFAYSTFKREDVSRNKIIQNVNHFYDIDKISDEEILKLIKSHNLDIAVDLSGYTLHNKSYLFEHEISKIKINYLGFPGTMGSKKYDYILADQNIIPENNKNNYTEDVLYMPDIYQPFSTKNFDMNIKRSEFNLPENKLILGCFSRIEKIMPNVFDVWMKILNNIKNTCLVLYISDERVKKNIKIYCDNNKFDFSKIIFLSYLDHQDNLRRISTFDLYLDTYPYNGHTAISDSLFQSCVPTISYSGYSFASRVSYSLLKSLNLEKLIAYSESEYYQKINYYCSNLEELKKIKEYLIGFKKDNTQRMKKFTKDYEKIIYSVIDKKLKNK